MAESTDNLVLGTTGLGTDAAPRVRGTLLHGPVSRPLLRLAGPVIVAYLIQWSVELVNLAWVGRLPNAEVPVAAVGLAAYVTWLMNGVVQLIVIGITTLVAQAAGRGDLIRARRVAADGIAFGLPFGLACGAIGFFSLDPLFDHLGVGPVVAEQARGYLLIFFAGLPFTYWMMAFDSAQRGIGDTITPLWIGALAFGLNACLDPLLIFGLGPLPGLGVQGAAIASLTARATAVVVYALRARRGRLLVRPSEVGFRFSPATLLACARIGLPISVVGILFMLVYLELVHLIAPFGAAAVAALVLGNRLEGLTFVIVDAIAVATQTMVGQNVGANQPRRALRVAWSGVGWGLMVGAVVGLTMLLFPEALLRAVAPDASPHAIAYGAAYCRLTAACQLFMVFEIVLTGAFAGVGYTVPAMLNSVPITLSRIPIAAALIGATTLGATAIYVTIASTCALRGIVALVWFRFGRWRRTRLGLVPASGG